MCYISINFIFFLHNGCCSSERNLISCCKDDLYFAVKDVVFKTKVFNRHGTFDRIANRNMENLDYVYLHCDLLDKATLTPISFQVKSPQINV